MNVYLLCASILTVLIGLVHSYLGEHLIFSKLRAEGLIPTKVMPPMSESNIRIIWASWHLVTVFGFCVAAIMYWLGLPNTDTERFVWMGYGLAAAMLFSSLLVLIATKGKHPGWIGLLIVGILVLLSH